MPVDAGHRYFQDARNGGHRQTVESIRLYDVDGRIDDVDGRIDDGLGGKRSTSSPSAAAVRSSNVPYLPRCTTR
jgi:hypothetical protein